MIGKTERSVVSLLLALTVAGSVNAQPVAERRIVLFGANWCAPCLAELRDLPQIVRAAAPDRVIVAWIDDGVRVPEIATKSGVMQVSPDRARELMARHGTGSAGLPLAVMLDAEDRRCGMWRRRLDSAGIASLRRDCRTGI